MREPQILSKFKNAIFQFYIREKMWNKSLRNIHRACGYTEGSRKTIEMWKNKINS